MSKEQPDKYQDPRFACRTFPRALLPCLLTIVQPGAISFLGKQLALADDIKENMIHQPRPPSSIAPWFSSDGHISIIVSFSNEQGSACSLWLVWNAIVQPSQLSLRSLHLPIFLNFWHINFENQLFTWCLTYPPYCNFIIRESTLSALSVCGFKVKAIWFMMKKYDFYLIQNKTG